MEPINEDLEAALRAVADALDEGRAPLLGAETCREAADALAKYRAEVEHLEDLLEMAGGRLMGADI